MKNIIQKDKKTGMTLIETAISLGLISIFILLVFPLLKLTNELEERFHIQEQLERNSTRIIELLEKNIEEGTFGIQEYFGRDTLVNGKGVFVISQKPPSLDERFFNNRNSEGNTLFIEIPYVKNEKIYSKYLVYRFFNNELLVSPCSYLQGTLYFEGENTLLSNVTGGFKMEKEGIKINMKLKKIEHKYFKELNGYALIGVNYE